ncbi:hypothetical protein G9A89_011520 [Geosiphon pyriformis]|nr:hypothetical protein G9A89_011520 [Geosiphon pyriformis]
MKSTLVFALSVNLWNLVVRNKLHHNENDNVKNPWIKYTAASGLISFFLTGMNFIFEDFLKWNPQGSLEAGIAGVLPTELGCTVRGHLIKYIFYQTPLVFFILLGVGFTRWLIFISIPRAVPYFKTGESEFQPTLLTATEWIEPLTGSALFLIFGSFIHPSLYICLPWLNKPENGISVTTRTSNFTSTTPISAFENSHIHQIPNIGQKNSRRPLDSNSNLPSNENDPKNLLKLKKNDPRYVITKADTRYVIVFDEVVKVDLPKPRLEFHTLKDLNNYMEETASFNSEDLGDSTIEVVDLDQVE